jgi:hypothetical protein
MELAITSAITLVGLYLAHSLIRQQRVRVAEERVACYRELWELMAVARPDRLLAADGAGPMTVEEAGTMYDRFSAWYFDRGRGMMLTAPTLAMYVVAKRRLAASLAAARAGEADWTKDSLSRMRELSLLRTQMKSDVAIYGRFYRGYLGACDHEFLRACGLNPSRWARPWWQRLMPMQFGQARPPKDGLVWPPADGTGVAVRD